MPRDPIRRPPAFIGSWDKQYGSNPWMSMIDPINGVILKAQDVLGKKKEGKNQRSRSKRSGSRVVKVPTRTKKRTLSSKKGLMKFNKDIPLGNFDLLDWCKYLKIPIKDVSSCDRTEPHNHRLAIFIYNLAPHYMSRSHWVSTYVRDGVISYFDSFGLPPFQEIVDHAKKKNLTLLHQNQQIQNLYTATCGWFCLYFLNEYKGNDYF